MRYLLVTYIRKPNGQIDEQVGFGKRVKDRDWQTVNVIVDFQEKKVKKCLIDGKVVDTDYEKMVEYYRSIYPQHIEEMIKMNTPQEPQQETTDGQ